jgi:hypothetical protein
VPDHGHSAKGMAALSNSSLLLSLSLSYRVAAASTLSLRRRRALAPPRPCPIGGRRARARALTGPPPCPRLPAEPSPAHRELAHLWQNHPNYSSLSA